MRRFFILLISILCTATISAQPAGKAISSTSHTLEWYYPASGNTFDSSVPAPSKVLGYEIGERFVEWSDVLKYVEAINASSPRVSLKYWGNTYEGRPFVQMVITDPSNQKKLEELRLDHLSHTGSENCPVVVDIMASIHGREPSGTSALLAVAYWYAAATDPQTVALLKNTIIVITPSLNPDGMNRYANWINSKAALNKWVDNNSREHFEPSPDSRLNHYFMDLNRHWLSASSLEGENAVQMYRYWMPNVVLDVHEQAKGNDGMFFFSPGDPTKVYKYISARNIGLQGEISEYTKKASESLGIRYFTNVVYDDYSIGKGASYCNIQGGIGILHEQLATRGHLKEFDEYGVLTFPRTVQIQTYAMFAVIRATYELRRELIDYQHNFFEETGNTVKADPQKGYVFDAGGNRGIAYHFIKNLRLHGIKVYEQKNRPGHYTVPFTADNYYLIKTIFEDITEYDKPPKDVSTWSQARAYGLNFQPVHKIPSLGAEIVEPLFPSGNADVQAGDAAYAFAPSEYYVPRMVSALQYKGVPVKVSPDGFVKGNTHFPAGTFVVPSGNVASEDIRMLAGECGVDVTSLKDTSNIKLKQVRYPYTAIVHGPSGLNPDVSTGSFWYLLDYYYGMRHSIMDYTALGRSNLDKYDVIVLIGNTFNLKSIPGAYEKLEQWLTGGGTLILQGQTASLSEELGYPCIKDNAGSGIYGAVFSADKVSESPLLWGYDGSKFQVFKLAANVWTVSRDADVVMSWSRTPYLSGYASGENIARIAGTPMLATKHCGKGTVICMQEDFNFRSYWFATSHICTNAIFFGDMIYN